MKTAKSIDDCLDGVSPEKAAEIRDLFFSISQSRAGYKDLVDFSGHPILLIDYSGKVLESNLKLPDVLGIDITSFIGSSLLEYMNDESRERFKSASSDIQNATACLMDQEYVLIDQEGKRRLFSFGLDCKIRADGSNVLHLEGTDITKRKELEDRVKIYEKLSTIGELASGIMHEIKTPLSYVDSNTAFLETVLGELQTLISSYRTMFEYNLAGEKVPNDIIESTHSLVKELDNDGTLDEIAGALSDSIKGIDHIKSIVSIVQRFNHFSHDAYQDLNINDSLEAAVLLSKNEWKYCAILEAEYDPSTPNINANSHEIGQVYINLIVNAAHAIQEYQELNNVRDLGKIHLTTKDTGDYVEIHVRDTGIGISPDNSSSIFDPFYTTKPNGKGTGQGLSISKRIIEEHGGEISYKSRYNSGTTFIIKLPKKKP